MPAWGTLIVCLGLVHALIFYLISNPNEGLHASPQRRAYIYMMSEKAVLEALRLFKFCMCLLFSLRFKHGKAMTHTMEQARSKDAQQQEILRQRQLRCYWTNLNGRKGAAAVRMRHRGWQLCKSSYPAEQSTTLQHHHHHLAAWLQGFSSHGCSFNSHVSPQCFTFVFVLVCLSLSVCLSVRPSVSLSLFLSFSISLFLSFSLSLFLSFFFFFFFLSLSLSLSLSFSLCPLHIYIYIKYKRVYIYVCIYIYLSAVGRGFGHLRVVIWSPKRFPLQNRAFSKGESMEIYLA